MKGTLYQCQVNDSMGTLDLQGEDTPLGDQTCLAYSERQHGYGESTVLSY